MKNRIIIALVVLLIVSSIITYIVIKKKNKGFKEIPTNEIGRDYIGVFELGDNGRYKQTHFAKGADSVVVNVDSPIQGKLSTDDYIRTLYPVKKIRFISEDSSGKDTIENFDPKKNYIDRIVLNEGYLSGIN